MAKKNKAEKPQRELTRRQLSHQQRQKRRQRIITIGGISIIAAAILIVLIGWFLSEFRPMHQTVIRVNDTEFNMAYYIDALRVSGQGQTALTIQSLAGYVTKQIEQDELIRQGALKLGISVSDNEAEKKLLGSKLPVNAATVDMVRSVLLQDKLRSEYFDSQVPKTAAQAQMMAMLLESQGQADEIRARLQNSENFTSLAGEFSQDDYTKKNQGNVGWHTEAIFDKLLGSSVPGQFAFASPAGTLSQPTYDEGKTKHVGYWLLKVLEKQAGATDAQVQGILLGNEQEAQDIRARLENGEDLAAIAKEHSQNDKSRNQGGELGVVSQGDMSPAVDGYIFNPEVAPGKWSDPIRDETAVTKGAYWLIEVVGRADDRPIDSTDRDSMLAQKLSDWTAALQADPGNKIDDKYLDAERQKWAAGRAAGS